MLIDVIFMTSVEARKVNSKENGKEWKKLKNIFSVFDFFIWTSYDIDFYMEKHLKERV